MSVLPQTRSSEIIIISDDDDEEEAVDDDFLTSPFDGNEFLSQWTGFIDVDQVRTEDETSKINKANRAGPTSNGASKSAFIDLEDNDTEPQIGAVIPPIPLPHTQPPYIALPASGSSVSTEDAHETILDPETLYQVYRERVLEVFPNISLEFLKQTYDARAQETSSQNMPISIEAIIQRTVLEVSDLEEYPKQRETRKKKESLKRKRGDDPEGSHEDDLEWVQPGKKYPSSGEHIEAHRLLSLSFEKIPVHFISEQLAKCGTLYLAYRAIEAAERSNKSGVASGFRELKKRRKSIISLAGTYPQLQIELEAAKERSRKDEATRNKRLAEAEAEAALEKKAFEEGDILECQCCFTEVPTTRTSHCDDETPHFFCFDCASSNAKAQLDLSRYKLRCMDSSGCTAEFARSERIRFLDDNTLIRLDRLQQQHELREADLPDLEHCPFCDYAAICPPIEIDREFRCLAPNCELTSCRSCKQISHIPKSCEEYRKEQGIEERHIVEEEMTNALLRRCPKKSCGVPIVKTDGCNKVICTQCGCYICDVCGKDITKQGYAHFRGGGGRSGTCPQSDDTVGRENQRIEEAAKLAKARIRAENPDISEDDLDIKFSNHVKGTISKRHRMVPQAAQLPRLHEVPLQRLNQGQQAIQEHQNAVEQINMGRQTPETQARHLRQVEARRQAQIQAQARRRTAWNMEGPQHNLEVDPFQLAPTIALPLLPFAQQNGPQAFPNQQIVMPQNPWLPAPVVQAPHPMQFTWQWPGPPQQAGGWGQVPPIRQNPALYGQEQGTFNLRR